MNDLDLDRQAIMTSIDAMARRAGLSTRQLGKRAGLANGYLAKMKLGRHWPKMDTIARLGEAAGVTAEEWAMMVEVERQRLRLQKLKVA